MIDYKEIEEKIKSMSARDIIMAIVEGLRNRRIEIDLSIHGAIRDGVCFGCAATNTILHIMKANKKQVKSYITYTSNYDDYSLGYTIRNFEYAIDILSRGLLETYNDNVKDHGFPHITPIPGQNLPFLDNDFTEEELQEYVKLAEYQLTI